MRLLTIFQIAILTLFMAACSGSGQVTTKVSRVGSPRLRDMSADKPLTGHFLRGQSSVDQDILLATILVDETLWVTQLALPILQLKTDPQTLSNEAPFIVANNSIEQQIRHLGKDCATVSTSQGVTFLRFKRCSKRVSNDHRMEFSGHLKICTGKLDACSSNAADAKIAIVLEREGSFEYRIIDKDTKSPTSTVTLKKLDIFLNGPEIVSGKAHFRWRADRESQVTLSQVTRQNSRVGSARSQQQRTAAIMPSTTTYQVVRMSIANAVLSILPISDERADVDPQRIEKEIQLEPTGISVAEEQITNGLDSRKIRELTLLPVGNEPLRVRQSCDGQMRLRGQLLVQHQLAERNNSEGVVELDKDGIAPVDGSALKMFKQKLPWPTCSAASAKQ